MGALYPAGIHSATHMPVFVLDQLRSAFNVGSAYRTADAISPCAVFTCGITAHPWHRKLGHTARGTQNRVPWRHFESTIGALRWLAATGRRVVVLETSEAAIPIWEAPFGVSDAFVFGNEALGAGNGVLDAADLLVRFPQSGERCCINVASMIAIVAAEIQRRRMMTMGERALPRLTGLRRSGMPP